MDDKISVLISTWNNLPYLKASLESLKRHSVEDVEICVTIDGSKDQTHNWLLDNCMEFNVKWIKLDKHVGSITGRRKAAQMASGKFVLLAEDALMYHPGWDTNLLELYYKHDKNDIITIQVCQATGYDKFVAKHIAGNIVQFKEQDYLDFVKEKSSPKALENVSWGLPFFRRGMLEQVGGEDVGFDPISFSIMDLKMRMKQKHPNMKFRRAQNVLPWHFISKSWEHLKGTPEWEADQQKCRNYLLEKWGFDYRAIPRVYENLNKPGYILQKGMI